MSPASVARGPALMAAALAALRADGYPLAVLWTPPATFRPGGHEEVRYARTL